MILPKALISTEALDAFSSVAPGPGLDALLKVLMEFEISLFLKISKKVMAPSGKLSLTAPSP